MNFCTLFNSAYLSRGLAMYNSLMATNASFHLYIYAFDDECCKYFKLKNYKNITVISLPEFENENLLSVKNKRSAAEYCWTCTPSVIDHAIHNYDLEECTYIDADLYFYSDPQVLLDEMSTDSVLITEHRYTKEYDQTELSGKYCVQFICFKNNPTGLRVLHWWRDACIDWCFARHEEGKFGDQKYLDNWPEMFDGICILQHLGGGVAPWNAQQYEFFIKDKFFGVEIKTRKKFELIFFHFHAIKFFKNDIISFSIYKKSKNLIRLLYKPYVKRLLYVGNEIKEEFAQVEPHGIVDFTPSDPMTIKLVIQFYLQDIKSSIKNMVGINLRNRINKHPYYKIDK
ncbi:glycosyl transferase [soil metagenome]